MGRVTFEAAETEPGRAQAHDALPEKQAEPMPLRAVRVRARPAVRFFQVLGYVLAAPGALLFLLGAAISALEARPHAGDVMPFLLWAITWGAWPVERSYASRRRRGGTLTLLPGGLRVRSDGMVSTWQKESIVGAYRLAGVNGAVLLLANGSELQVELEPTTKAVADVVEELLLHVGMGPNQRAAVAPLHGTNGPFGKGALAFTFTLAAWVVGFLLLGSRLGDDPHLGVGLLAACAMSAFVVARFGYPRLVVGADGVRLEGGWRTRFIPYAEIASAARYRDRARRNVCGVRITRTDGEDVLLPLIGQSEDQKRALVERILAARSGYVAVDDARIAQALDRGGRTIDAWKADLARAALSEGTFREQPLRRDDFERVLADPSAPLMRRVGAAIALRAVDPDASRRIRVATEASADERARGALEAASRGEVDEDLLVEDAAAERR
jgi:hypothetical protein